nr:immunoglobulin light chain junction region [Macaca mulatta]
CQQCNTVPYSF